ncbi:MAG: alanine racemase, partial [Albidovulum sp.]
MASGTLTIDLAALAANWRALAAMGRSEAAAVLKADGYGLGAGPVARALWAAGARRFFVAVAEEGAALRQALAPEAEINILSGHMAGDTGLIRDHDLTPMLNSAAQVRRHLDALPGHGFGIQIDTGMHRLGMTPGEWAGLAPEV